MLRYLLLQCYLQLVILTISLYLPGTYTPGKYHWLVLFVPLFLAAKGYKKEICLQLVLTIYLPHTIITSINLPICLPANLCHHYCSLRIIWVVVSYQWEVLLKVFSILPFAHSWHPFTSTPVFLQFHTLLSYLYLLDSLREKSLFFCGKAASVLVKKLGHAWTADSRLTSMINFSYH